jgi:crotonobetainyl-CoA:carnitine CoA-transferase CaiB-like acyl-CoA transferase
MNADSCNPRASPEGSTEKSPVRVLAGIRVIDLGSYITAPYAAMMLGELGADVIKVERPGGEDPFRQHTGDHPSAFFFAFNRNKRALCLDYTKSEGHAVLMELVRTADILLVNVRPGVEEKIGLGVRNLQTLNPKLIYCSITGYGANGPYAGRPAYDNVGQTLSGLLSRFHQQADPRIAGPAITDSLTGLYACIGILAALQERTNTGRGRHVEVNMIESALAFAIEPLTHVLMKGEDQTHYYRGASSQAYLLTCRDGLRIGLHMSSPDKFWLALTRAIERPDLAERFPTSRARLEAYEEIAQSLAEVFSKKDRAEWLPRLAAEDVPFAPERRLSEIEADEQVRHLGTFVASDQSAYGTDRVPNRAPRFDGDNRSVFRPPPRVGEHTAELLQELGLDQAGIERLRERNIIL